MKLLSSLTAIALAVGLVGCSPSAETTDAGAETAAAETKFITIGTGGVTGTYYPTGGAICRMVKAAESPIRCSVESTGGSVYNVNTIKAGELDFGISQSDTAYQALNGEGKFSDAPVEELRSVLAIYPELLALVVRDDAGIATLKDIEGKRINIDVPGSGTRMTTESVLEANGISLDKLALVNELKSSEGPTMLKDRKVDGYFGMFGHPTANIKDAANSVGIDLVPINGPAIDALVAEKPYYASGIIAAENYEGVDEDVPSLGVKAVLVTRENMADDAVATIIKAVLDNFEEFKESHPAYKNITKESLLDGLAVPQHPAAAAVFEEYGITAAAAPADVVEVDKVVEVEEVDVVPEATAEEAVAQS